MNCSTSYSDYAMHYSIYFNLFSPFLSSTGWLIKIQKNDLKQFFVNFISVKIDNLSMIRLINIFIFSAGLLFEKITTKRGKETQLVIY